MVSGSVCSRTLSTTNLGASFGSVLRVYSLADATVMRTSDKLGSTWKTTVPAVNVTSIVVATGCVDRLKDQFHSLWRFYGPFFVVSTNSKELITELIMKVGQVHTYWDAINDAASSCITTAVRQPTRSQAI
jgi:hypothetical protein